MIFNVSSEVAGAIARGGGTVALETTLICHGIPRPRNADLALAIEERVRAASATPATVAVLDGCVRVGLTRSELRALAARDDVEKCSTRDLAPLIAGGLAGATTVASTVWAAHRTGIPVMATGGIGGVHRGGEASLDESADLGELGRCPVVVVCSGIKAILDIGRTLERLETLGIGVVGFACDELPAFYCRESGHAVRRVDDVAGLARLVHAHRRLGLETGLVVANPPPAELALTRRALETLTRDAIRAARERGIGGAAETPFLLAHMAEASDGATVRVNEALVLANAELAGRLAVALSELA